MGLGGFILGGALAGAGKGMALQAEQSALERREARLAAARAAERQEDREWRKEDLKIAEDSTARRDQRLHNQDIEKEGFRFSNQVTLADKSDATQLERDRLNHARDMEKLEKDWGFRMTSDARERAFRAQQELGKPIDTITDEQTGERILIYNDPEQKSGVRRVRIKGVDTRKPDTGGSGSSLLDPPPAKGAAKPATPAKLPSQSSLTYTREDLEYTARTNNMTVAQVEKQLRDSGYKPADR